MKYDQDGINKKTYDLLFSDKENIRKIDLKEGIRGHIINMIDTYTKIRKKSIFYSMLKLYFGFKYHFDYSKIVWNEENQEYEIEFLGEKYTFNKISNLLDDNDKKMIEELESEKRYGNCHIASMGFATNIPNANVLTGYVNISGGRFLHSVIELRDGRIIDWTRNTIMPREEYMKLMDYTVIESISDKELVDVFSKFSNFDGFNSKVLATFATELLRDMQRNPDFFKDNEELREKIETIRRNNSSRPPEEERD